MDWLCFAKPIKAKPIHQTGKALRNRLKYLKLERLGFAKQIKLQFINSSKSFTKQQIVSDQNTTEKVERQQCHRRGAPRVKVCEEPFYIPPDTP